MNPPAEPGPFPDVDRLRRLLGAPELAWFLERVRRRMERAQPLTGVVTLAIPSGPQRAAVDRLLGRAPGAGGSLSVRLEAVDALLRHSGACLTGLASAVTALTGPVTLIAEAREREAAAWREAYAPLDTLPPELADWAGELRLTGLVRRLAGTPVAALALLTDATKVLRALPAEPAEPAASLPAFAARLLGNAHALDDGTALATLVLSGIRALTGIPEGSGAEGRRDTWASAGLLRDDLSSTVLVLNLRGTPALDWLAATGQPAVLTLRQLTHTPPRTSPGLVRICENPTVLAAAADAYGGSCPPLVCLQGQPSTAALTLLDHLHSGGATLQYHGDFDWGGLRIATVLHRRVPWRPWRYTTADYRTAAAALNGLRPLTGTPTEAAWDPDLALALTEAGVRVEEESVLDDLLADLKRQV
nr:TIGR02679 family protein [Streptomyces sp. MZ04]